mgnify:FL=1
MCSISNEDTRIVVVVVVVAGELKIMRRGA